MRRIAFLAALAAPGLTMAAAAPATPAATLFGNPWHKAPFQSPAFFLWFRK
jgi:hypothetical protein